MRPRFFLLPLLLLLSLLLTSIRTHAVDAEHFVERSVTLQGKTYRYQVFVPDGWTAKKIWPVVLFLHGSGEAGADNTRQMTQGLPPWLRQHGATFPAVVVIPQAPEHT